MASGQWLPEEIASGQFYFSQFGEEFVLATLLEDRKTGFWVDVGAYHPLFLSNTYAFSKKGWQGINIEPNPFGFAEFRRLRPNDINLNVAVSEKPSTVEFSCDGPYSGIRDANYIYENRNETATTITVDALPIADILRTHVPKNVTIDFMSVDCEGHDMTALQSNSWSEFRPKVLLVESHPKEIKGEQFNFLTSVGYVYYCRMGLTNFYIEQEEAVRHQP